MKRTCLLPHRVFLPDWVWALAFISTIVSSILANTPWPFLGIVILAAAQGLYVFNFVHCPTCSGRLTFHQALVPHTTRYRFQLACRRCQVFWDTGKSFEDRTD